MPERKRTFRVESVEVQGDGSFVILRKLSWVQRQEAQLLLAEAAGGELPQDKSKIRATTAFLTTNRDFTREMLGKAVERWNWVQDDGTAMPLPADGGMELLSEDEVLFLVRALQPKEDAGKN
jgi:hypothetical protein